MTFITDTIKGIFIGIANIIPGVSGGTIALSMGIYDKLIGAVSNFFKDWKKSVITLLPILIGCGIGLVGFTFAIEYLLSEHTFVTCMTFIGLILGGLPILIRQLKEKLHKRGGSIGLSDILAFVILFALAIFLPLLDSGEEVLKTLTATPGHDGHHVFYRHHRLRHHGHPRRQRFPGSHDLGYYYGTSKSLKTFLDPKGLRCPRPDQRFFDPLPPGHRNPARHLPDRQADHLFIRTLRRTDLLRHPGPDPLLPVRHL